MRTNQSGLANVARRLGLVAVLVAAAACTQRTPPTPTTTTTPPPSEPAPAPTPTPDPVTPPSPAGAMAGEPCGAGDACGEGACVAYRGIAGARGPEFKTCEIRCADDGSCPAGKQCRTIADGPGKVCR